MKTFAKNCILLSLTMTLALISLGGKSGSEKGAQNKALKIPDFKYLDVNTLNVTCNSNGDFASSDLTNSAGAEWPKGTGKTCVYAAGLWVAGLHRQTHAIRGAFMDQGNEFQPGPLLEPFNTTTNDGSAANARASDNKWRLYKINRSDIGNPSGNPDYTGWPGDAGAPYVDVNGNGQWDPGIDVPKFYGDQQLWAVINDVNSNLHSAFGTTPPMGIEVQSLYYGYNLTGPLGNTVFLKWKIINKSDADYDSVYVSIWSDIDLGNGNDDLPGCDTTLNLGYVYNGSNNDAGSTFSYGVDPPADGFAFLEGPRVPGLPTDSAVVDGQWIHGFKNLPMTACVNYFNGTFTQCVDPPLGDPRYPGIAYDYMKGLAGTVHQPVYSTVTSKQITKWFSGDPTTQPPTGDLPSNFYFGTVLPQDVRIMLSSGPFTLARGDTQEVVCAFLIARGTDNINSVTLLKQDVAKVRSYLIGAQPIAAIAPIGTYVPTQSPVALAGSANVTTGTITGTQWIVSSKPSGSSATIANPLNLNTSITPDVPGSYGIQFIATSSSGLSDTATTTFWAVNNHPPNVDFAVPSQIVLGDTIHIDGSAIHDIDGDPLAIHWTVDGGRYFPLAVLSYADSTMGRIADSSASYLTYFPFRTSRFTVTASVSDPYYTVELKKDVVVLPITTAGFTLHSRYATAGLPLGGLYGFGPIREFSGQIWCAAYGGLFTPNFADNAHPAQAYPFLVFGNFVVSGSSIFAAEGMNGVEFAVTDNSQSILHDQFIRPSAPRTGNDTTAVDVFYRSPFLFFSYGVLGVWAYDVSNVAFPPIIVGQFTDGDYWGNFAVDGNLLYCMNPRTNRVQVLDIEVPQNMSLKKTVLPGPGYGTIRKYGSNLYFVKADTVGIYDISDTSNIFPLVKIPVPRTFLPKNRFYDVSCYGRYLVAGTHEGLYIYDMIVPTSPSILGKYITGFAQIHTFLNDRWLIADQWDWWNPGYIERPEGLLEYTTPITSVGNTPTAIPSSCILEQNYPNPFNPSSTIRYGLPLRSRVTLTVYNTLGQRVVTLVNGDQQAGYHEVRFDGSGLASGVYFYRIQAGSFVETKKFLLLR